MDDLDQAYDELLAICRERFPEVARQVQDEVSRGMRLERSQLRKEDREAREERMKAAKVGRRIGKDEQAVVPYSDEQRLLLLMNALERWLQVADGSRQQLQMLTLRHEIAPVIRFSNPDEVQPETATVAVASTDDDLAARNAVRVLGEAQTEVLSES